MLDAKDLSAYTRGFSLVTNMRLIIADDTNIVETTTPDGITLPYEEKYYPPLSMFAPEKTLRQQQQSRPCSDRRPAGLSNQK